MSAYKKVAAAKARLKSIEAMTGRAPVQNLALGGLAGGGDSLGLGGGSALSGGGAFSTGDFIPGIRHGLGDTFDSINPFKAAKNNFQAEVPTSAQYNFADPARTGERMITDASGALGGVSGSLGGLGGQQGAFTSGVQGGLSQYGNIPGQQQGFVNTTLGGAAGFGNVGLRQQMLADQLQQQALGGGPNPAQAQFQANLGQGLAANESAIASARGLNPALAAQMAAQSNARLIGQGAANEATLQAQQQLAAQNALGGLTTNMGGLQLGNLGQAGGMLGTTGQQRLGTVGLVQQGMRDTGNTYSQQGNVIGQQLTGGENLYGTSGSLFNNQESRNGNLTLGTNQINAGVASGNAAGKAGMVGGIFNAAGGIASSLIGGGGGAAGGTGGASTAGGEAALDAASMVASRGGRVPGRPQVARDSETNDTVRAALSPGEIVLPLHITQSPNAPELAAEFVRGVMHGRGPKPHYRKMAEGGEVDEPAPDEGRASDSFAGVTGPGTEPTSDYDAPAPSAPQPQFGSGALPSGGTFGQLPQSAPAPNANTLPPLGGGQPQAAQTIPAAPNPMAGYNSGFGMQAAGLGMAADAAQQEGEQKAAAYQKYVETVNQAAQVRDAAHATIQAEDARLTKDYTDGKIEPQRIWANASTGGKISAAIGLALSGIGSGLTGQQNMAMGVINKLVDEDVKAQYADLGKKKTLLSMNLEKYGRIDAAYNATLAQQHAIVGAQIGEAAANAEGPKAAAQAQILGGQIQNQKAALQQKVAQTAVDNAVQQKLFGGGGGGAEGGGGSGGGGGGFTSKAQLDSLAHVSPVAAEYSKRAVDIPLPGGKQTVMFARNEKDASESQQSLASINSFEEQLHRGAADLLANGASMKPLVRAEKAASLKTSLTVQLNELYGLKRLTDTELHEYQKIVPSAADWNTAVGAGKYEELQKLVDSKKHAVYSTLSGGQRPVNPLAASAKFKRAP